MDHIGIHRPTYIKTRPAYLIYIPYRMLFAQVLILLFRLSLYTPTIL